MKRSTIFALILSAACGTTAFAQKPAAKADAKSDGALKGDFNCGMGGVTYLAKKK